MQEKACSGIASIVEGEPLSPLSRLFSQHTSRPVVLLPVESAQHLAGQSPDERLVHLEVGRLLRSAQALPSRPVCSADPLHSHGPTRFEYCSSYVTSLYRTLLCVNSLKARYAVRRSVVPSLLDAAGLALLNAQYNITVLCQCSKQVLMAFIRTATPRRRCAGILALCSYLEARTNRHGE